MNALMRAGTSFMNRKPNKMFVTFDVVAYILAAVIARQYSGWQIALAPGFGAFMVGQILTALGCICHYLCLLEIWSAVPFSGGSYALSRATLGFYLGFLDGCLEALVYIGHTSLSALGAGTRMCTIFDLDPDYATFFALMFYAIALILSVQKSSVVYRRSFIALAGISVVILFIFCFGSMKWSNFQENASLHRAEPESNTRNWFQGGWDAFIVIFPFTLQPYAGIRSFTLLTGMTENPKVTLPRAVVISFLVIIALNIMVVFVFVSQPGGIEHTAISGSSTALGWQLMFNTSLQKSLKIAAGMQLPATFARIYAYLVPAGVMLQSMAKSNLMPSILRINDSGDHTNGSIVSAIVGMGLTALLYYYPVIELLNLTVMATMITDCTFLYGYILLKTTYSTVPREFVSPFGMAGAIFSFLVYVLIFISAGFYQHDYFALQFFAVFLAAMSVYYFAFARTSQTLNEEEDHVFFKMHVRNFNMRKKSPRRYPCERRRKHSNRVAAAAGSDDEDVVKAPVDRSVDSNVVTSQGQSYTVSRATLETSSNVVAKSEIEFSTIS